MTQIPAGWYDDPNGGERRYWNGSAWQDEQPVNWDRGRWEQAPDGSWHRRSWWARYWMLVVLLAVLAGVAGMSWWEGYQADREVDRRTEEFGCIVGGDC